MTGTTENRVLELAALLCDELITDDQFAELDEILASDGKAREAYRGFIALHQRLQSGALEADHAVAMIKPPAANAGPVDSGVFRAVAAAAPGLALRDPVQPGGTFEGRIRRAERRAKWSMAACVVVVFLVIALLFRPTSKDSLQNANVGDPDRKLRAHEIELTSLSGHLEESPYRWRESSRNAPAPAPAPAPSATGAPAGSVADAGQIEESNGGVLIADAALNDTFEMLAKRAGKQYFHNAKVEGSEFQVSGRLKDGDPLQQMEELAFINGLTLHQKGNTVYALNEEQLNLPAEEWNYSLQTIRPDDIEQVKALIQPMLSPTGIANYEPKTNTLTIIDSAHKVDRARELLRAIDKPASKSETESGQIQTELGGGGPQGLAKRADLSSPTPTPAILGIHSDDASWRSVANEGGVFANKTSKDALTSSGFVRPLRPGPLNFRRRGGEPSNLKRDNSLAGGASGNIEFKGQINHIGKNDASQFRTLDIRSRMDDERLVDAGQAVAKGPLQATISLIDRVPIINTTINENAVNNQVTDEVRYQVDLKDPVGDPRMTREIGVTLKMTPTLLSDGTIRMKIRPRSAQVIEEIIGQSGNRYSQVSESMLETIARIPEGYSLVVGGFYGQVKSKDDNKIPLLGDIPKINLFLKGKETAQEPTSLLFVVTPRTFNDQVAIDTKILSINSTAGERTGVDWTSSLGEAGVPLESIRGLNALFGIESAGETSGAAAVSDSPIVLSPAQAKEVIRALSSSGLVTHTSSPTVIAKALKEDPIAPTDRERNKLDEADKWAADEPYSTFSLHVSDVSFKLAKAALARGEWPAVDQIRVEEFVNAFDYGDPAPMQGEKVACRMEQAAHPFLQQRNLLRISMRTAALGRSASTPLRLTVLLDKSGSMERMDRAESVRNAFQLLADQLNPQDQVTLIGFARTPRLLADRVAGDRVGELVKLAESAPVGGGTNLEQALELGIAKAVEQMLEGAQNRIILLTDGAANLGNAKPEDLAKLVEKMRQQGIAFDACGVGADGVNDRILESLARKGDGRYYFLDRPEDADHGFARQIAGALRPAARNMKVQVIFNPNRVGRYKLYGFEKHRLKKEDFRNDKVDAAELAAEEAGNAIYQVELLPEGSGEIGTVSVRFQDTESGRMIEREWTIPYEAQVPRLEDAAASLRLASSAALLGEKLKGSLLGESVEMERLGKLMNSLISDFPFDKRVKELVQMANKVRDLRGE